MKGLVGLLGLLLAYLLFVAVRGTAVGTLGLF